MKIQTNRRIFKRIFWITMTVLLLLAWSPNSNEAPYTGAYSVSYPASGQVKSNAGSVKWTSTAISAMDGDANSEYIDQTADCVGAGSDRLHVSYAVTNIPDRGVSSYNDCGNSSIKEEVELHVNEDSLVAGTAYYYNVVWLCKVAPTSGEINISFEPGPLDHDWLDKVNYSCSSTASPASRHNSTAANVVPTSRALETESDSKSVVYSSTDNIFAYQVMRMQSGKLRARVNAELDNAKVFRQYKRYNEALAEQLAVDDHPVLAVITFTSPVSPNELREFVANAGISEIVSYSAFHQSTEDNTVAIHVWPVSRAIEEIPVVDDMAFEDAMTVTGILNSSSLPSLVTDRRVALVDLVANEVQLQVQAELGEAIDLTEIGVSNPAWSIYAQKPYSFGND